MPSPRYPRIAESVILGLDQIDESEQYVADLLAAGGDPIHLRSIEAHRADARRGEVPSQHADVAVAERSVSAGGRSVVVRQFLPSGPPKGGYLHFHGGGWVFGAASMQDPELAELSQQLAIAVLAVDYRLAPENPFPAALDDAETAALWLAEEGVQELGPVPVAIGGESAGAHLAAVALQRLAVASTANPFRAANLVYGIFDLSMTPSQRAATDTPRMSRPDLEWYYDKVMPASTAEDRRHAAISPLYGELQGMPPARFAVGTLDPLFDDSAFMAARWARAGSPATLEIYMAGTHGLARQPTSLGCLARRRQAEFLAHHLEVDAIGPTRSPEPH